MVMQSELRTEADFFEWVRANMKAKFPELTSERTLANVWPPRAGINEIYDREAAQRAFQREDLQWIPRDFQGNVFE